ncbi:hypothetical protein DFS34DRAFT_593459 [Phlyctochytrium arcticum]|nr:hypothetical protein DFS34DRAFT_593459 [Phlyctochytrium arcticum]
MKIPSRSNIVTLFCSLIAPALLGTWLTTGTHTADAGCYKCHSDAPSFLNGYLDRVSTTPNFTRVACNNDVAIYMDAGVKSLPRSTTSWIVPFFTKAWRYMKKTYGSCVVPREVFGLAGPTCENFGAPKPYVAQLGTAGAEFYDGWDRHFSRFEASAGGSRTENRNLMMTSRSDWSNSYYNVKQGAIWSMCFGVEWGPQGTYYSPLSTTHSATTP